MVNIRGNSWHVSVVSQVHHFPLTRYRYVGNPKKRTKYIVYITGRKKSFIFQYHNAIYRDQNTNNCCFYQTLMYLWSQFQVLPWFPYNVKWQLRQNVIHYESSLFRNSKNRVDNELIQHHWSFPDSVCNKHLSASDVNYRPCWGLIIQNDARLRN